MKKYNDKWPTLYEAYRNIGAIGRAVQAGAYEVSAEKHIWMFDGKLVTQEFLEDLFS